MTKLLRLLTLSMLILVCGGINAQTTITFDATKDKASSDKAGAVSLTKDAVTINAENGILGNGKEYRFIKVRKLLLPLQKTRFFLSNLHARNQTKNNTVLAVLLQHLANTVSLARLELGPAKQVLLFLPLLKIRYVLPRLLSLLEKLTLQQLKSQQLPVTPLLKPLPL